MRDHRPVRSLLALVVLAGTVWVGARGVPPTVPPVGALVDPARGAWATLRADHDAQTGTVAIPGLGKPVKVVFDRRGVPHVFAESEDDAYRALGYVVARDRLFQLELQWRAGAGRISELAGARARPLDSIPRHLGLPDAARRKLARLKADSGFLRAAQAYADGVNAWIDGMAAGDVPVEYRLLGARPTRFEPIDVLHLVNRMAWMLSFDEADLRKRRVAALVGRAAADALFPLAAPLQEPVQPNGEAGPREDFGPLPPPGPPDTAARRVAALDARVLGALGGPEALGAGDALGSNNWAVAPSRTKAGRALLAGDPHLGLSLPSIWYEAHLVVPKALDVYGATIPGLPAVILGFNRDVAWTWTNTDAADVVDYYAERVDDERHPTRYFLDGEWRPLRIVAEPYRGPDGRVFATDTVRYTHRGPLVREGDRWLSLRWTLYDDSDEGGALLRAQHARSSDEWLAFMAGWGTPGQNMLVADRSGAIGIRSQGRFPFRPNRQPGDTVFDGRSRLADWNGVVQVQQLPQSVRPAQGFLVSANQQQLDPRQSGPYIGYGWVDPWRAMRINQLLRADSQVTPDAMRRLQTDVGSARADRFVPLLVAAGTRAGASPAAHEAARRLAEWDRRYARESRAPALFEAVMRALADRTWDELVPGDRKGPEGNGRVDTPSEMVLLELARDSASLWWDERATPGVRETRDVVLDESLADALGATREKFGAVDSAWAWGRVRHANIHHLLALKGFSALALPPQGGTATVSPTSGNGSHGSSWRMVVEMGPEPRAWTTYPGGQSGHPGSPRYADRIARWSAGELDSALVPRTPAALRGADVLSTLTLTPARR